MHYNEVCRFSTKVVTVPVGSTGSKGHGTDPPYQKQITEIMKKELNQLKALSTHHEQVGTCKLRYRVWQMGITTKMKNQKADSEAPKI